MKSSCRLYDRLRLHKWYGGFLALTVFACSNAEARKFDFKNERFATYFRGSYALARSGGAAFETSSGNSTTFDKKPARNVSGEFGFLFATEKYGIRIAGEVLAPQRFDDIKGSNAAGTELFNLKSEILAYVVTANLEYRLMRRPTSNLVFGVGGGIAFVNLDQDYTMTSTGTTELSVASYNETATNRVTVLQAYLGYEFLFTDVATLMFDIGYRHLPVSTFLSTKDTSAISGNQTSGNAIKDMNGVDRGIDLSGLFFGLSLRFFI